MGAPLLEMSRTVRLAGVLYEAIRICLGADSTAFFTMFMTTCSNNTVSSITSPQLPSREYSKEVPLPYLSANLPVHHYYLFSILILFIPLHSPIGNFAARNASL